jgi:ubiquinone/menaquinone biosynthesis C-methylase UbiE
MARASNWKQHWDQRSDEANSNFDFDRGVAPRDKEIEDLSERELLDFIDPQPTEVVFDGGCGTGANILLLHSKVKRIAGMDYSQGAVERCLRRIESNKIKNAEVTVGSITQIDMPDGSVDKAVCMSVLQYMDDREVRLAFTEFARVLKNGGLLVLHVKNLSSIYLLALWLGKKIKLLLGKHTTLCQYRAFRWYVRELGSVGFDITDYNSFNLFVLPKMPMALVRFLQRLELRNYRKRLFRLPVVRRCGADLKIKALLRKSSNG